MRIEKIMVAFLVSVVALTVMTGVVAAEDMAIYKPGTTSVVHSTDLVPGSTSWTQLDLCVYGFVFDAGKTHNLTNAVSVIVNPGGADASDIEIEFKERVPPGTQRPATYEWTQEEGAGGSETLDLYLKAKSGVPVGATYSITIFDTPSGVSYSFSTATVTTTTVPEFATIAIPAIAVLGLFLFFNKRKQKKK